MLINILVFVVASQQNNLFRIFELECEQKTNNFKRVLTSIDVVSEEQVVISMDVSFFRGFLPNIKESHQIDVASVDVSEYFDRRTDIFNYHRLKCKYLTNLVGKFNDVLSLARELHIRFCFLTLLWFQERFDEHLTESIIGVLINFSVILLAWVQFLWLLGEFIN